MPLSHCGLRSVFGPDFFTRRDEVVFQEDDGAPK